MLRLFIFLLLFVSSQSFAVDFYWDNPGSDTHFSSAADACSYYTAPSSISSFDYLSFDSATFATCYGTHSGGDQNWYLGQVQRLGDSCPSDTEYNSATGSCDYVCTPANQVAASASFPPSVGPTSNTFDTPIGGLTIQTGDTISEICSGGCKVQRTFTVTVSQSANNQSYTTTDSNTNVVSGANCETLADTVNNQVNTIINPPTTSEPTVTTTTDPATGITTTTVTDPTTGIETATSTDPSTGVTTTVTTDPSTGISTTTHTGGGGGTGTGTTGGTGTTTTTTNGGTTTTTTTGTGGGGGGGTGTGEGDSEEPPRLSSGGQSCDAAPSCSGDAINCAIVQQNYLQRCDGEQVDNDDFRNALTNDQELRNSDTLTENWLADERTIDNDSNGPDINSVLSGLSPPIALGAFSSSCISFPTFSVYGATYEINPSLLCIVLGALSTLGYLFAYIAAGFILFNSIVRD